MTTSTKTQPAAKIRDGAITATLWEKQGEHGIYFNTTISRTYKDGDKFKETNSFSGAELLRVSLIAQQAYTLEQSLKIETKEGNTQH